MYKALFTAIPAVLLVAACSINPRDYETTPVVVQTAAGPVTCQLYTKEQVIWDRSISRPNSMDVQTADNVCLAEGKRQKSGDSATAADIEPAAEL